jgi:hypothetical protein
MPDFICDFGHCPALSIDMPRQAQPLGKPYPVSGWGKEPGGQHGEGEAEALKAATESKDQKRELKTAHFYQGCIFAWNAYRGGKTITSIKFDTKKGLTAVNE